MKMFEVVFKNFENLLSQKYASINQNVDCIDGMFPRVYKQRSCDIELTMFSGNTGFQILDPEFLNNATDKFVRAIDVNIDDSKRISVSIILNYWYFLHTYYRALLPLQTAAVLRAKLTFSLW